MGVLSRRICLTVISRAADIVCQSVKRPADIVCQSIKRPADIVYQSVMLFKVTYAINLYQPIFTTALYAEMKPKLYVRDTTKVVCYR